MHRAARGIARLAVLAALGLPAAAARPETPSCGAAAGQARSFCSVTCGGETRRQSCGDRQICECRCVVAGPQCRCRPLGSEAGPAWRQADGEPRQGHEARQRGEPGRD